MPVVGKLLREIISLWREQSFLSRWFSTGTTRKLGEATEAAETAAVGLRDHHNELFPGEVSLKSYQLSKL